MACLRLPWQIERKLVEWWTWITRLLDGAFGFVPEEKFIQSLASPPLELTADVQTCAPPARRATDAMGIGHAYARIQPF